MSDERMDDAVEEALARLPVAVYAAEDGILREVGPGVEALLGQAGGTWVGRPLDELAPRTSDATAGSAVHRLRHVSGTSRLVRETWTRLERFDGVQVVCGVLIDAGEDAPDEHAPVRDPLTGLPTRAALRDHLHRAMARAGEQDETVALLHADLDEFRLVNESLGHAAGDLVIREVARRVREVLPGSCLVARVGGDSLCVVLEDLSADFEGHVHVAVDQLVGAVRRPVEVEGRSFGLGVTVGVSVFPRDGRDADRLLAHAEAALRQAKEEGRGGLYYYSGGTTGSLARLLLGAQLRRAIDGDELVLHYQPIFELASGRVAAVEGLLRWNSPDRGLVPPLDFIPVAEYTGLIEPIGRWVIDAAARQAAAWKAEGLGVPVSFNVSLRQFRDPEFVPCLRSALEREGIAPTDLVVEITESTAMRDPSCVEPVLAALRETGVPVAIDDFGSGHSSLGRLREMAVDILKVDRSLLPSEPDDPRAAAIGAATLGLVEALGVDAVAEGVETEEQRLFLAERGCALAQGFLLGRPLPAGEVTELLREAGARRA